MFVMQQRHWKIDGSGGEAIHGTTDEGAHPSCNLIIAHGFKGYKDYGCFPWLALKAAEAGARSHRFNFSHSGMLAKDGPFERADLFEVDTWNKQVEDLKAIVDHCHTPDLPTILLGHSRGGVASLLAVGRGEIDVDHLILLSSPSTCNSLDEKTQQLLLTQGYIESPSSRTNQMLRVGKCFLEEQFEDPESHDLLALATRIEIPITVIHGDDDQTVQLESGEAVSRVAKQGTLLPIHGGNHVFNTPNPFPLDGEASPQLQAVWEALLNIITQL
jgi:pimeloyl-ACP methyl ester carboxylesterase